MIYLDNNATTQLAPEARAALLPWLGEEFGNPSSMNAPGQRAREALQQARQNVATALGATPAELVFTSGATESNHAAILSALKQQPGRRHIVSTQVEHPGTLKLLDALQTDGVRVTLLGVNPHGELDLDQLADAVTHTTALVSVMWANNETGVTFPVEAIAALAHARGALFHTDAVQAVGRLPLHWQSSQIDLLSLSGHKLHALQGTGGLLVRKGVTFHPLLHGRQERHRRGGTENMLGIISLGAAATLLNPEQDMRIAQLRDRLEQGICSALPFATINGGAAARVAGTSSIRFGELSGEALQTRLERAGLVVATGAACQAGSNAPSHVLTAMGISRAAALATLRISLSRYSTAEEVDAATALIVQNALAMKHAHNIEPAY